jgi:hypothetical protein
MIFHVLRLTNSEVTASGITETEMGQTLLNGNNIAMVRSWVLIWRFDRITRRRDGLTE